MEIQQSTRYIQYVELLGWKHEKIEGAYVIYKHFPILGGLAKLQRPTKLPSPNKIIRFIKDNKIKTLAPEPDMSVSQKTFTAWLKQIKKHVAINSNPYIQTKTIRVNIASSEDEIFARFSEAKRRAVRRAIKNNVIIKESNDIKDLIRIKNKSGGLFGFITTYGIDKLWQLFAPKHAAILLAYSASEIVGGILLLFLSHVSYYWIAGATRKGKKLFAPTLLVWEALKLSKKRGCREFDFVGVIDERLPGNFKDWKGFTKFKEGFGGKPYYYPIAMPRK